MKTVIIMVLVIINISLISFFISLESRERRINDIATTQMESLLTENNIILDKKIVPKGSPKINSFYIERVTSENTEFITKLLGKGYSISDSGVISRGDKQLIIENDIIKFTDNNPENLKLNSAESTCIEYMKKIGIAADMYKYKSTNPSGNNTKLIFTAVYGSYEIFDSYISIEISDNGVCGIQAKNLILKSENADKNNRAVDINSVLVNLIKEHSNGSNKITDIVSINLGYYIGKYTVDYSRVLSIPAWQIVTNDGQIYCYDARNGRFINE